MTIPEDDLTDAKVQAGMSLATTSTAPPEDTLVRNARLIRTDWTYVLVKLSTALLCLLVGKVPYIPGILCYLIAHDFAVTWLRSKVASGNKAYKPVYLLTILMTIVFWTALACWLWQVPGPMARVTAIGILYAAPVMGAIRGFRDIKFLLATCTLPIMALVTLTISDLQNTHNPADILIGLGPLLLGVITVTRSVLTMRRRDRLGRMADVERNRLFAELEQAKSNLEQVTELSGVAAWDAELPSRSCNLSQAALKLLGLHAEPRALESFLGHFTPESSSAFLIALQDARKCGGTVDVDVQFKSNSETSRWIRLVGIAVNDDKGTCRFVGAMQDMSERVAQLERTRQEEVANALSRLSSRTAAEFKKDLIEISRSLAELGKRTSNGSLEHMLQQGMRLSVNRALDTAQSLQAYAANNPIEPGIININKSVSDIVIATKDLLPSKILLAVHTDQAELLAQLDEAELELSLLHLLLNARDSMEAGGSLTITTGTDENSWPYIVMRDTGLGMRPDVQSKIFEPFFSTKRPSGARGLGLSIVRGFVKQARGRLDVTSSPGAGSSFRLSFPPAGILERSAEVTTPNFKPVQWTILLAHEDESVLKALGPALLQEGLIMHYATSAKDGLSMLEGGVRYDGIVMSEPQARSLAGQALCARLPRQWPNAKVVVLAEAVAETGVSRAVPHLVLPSAEPAASVAHKLAKLIRSGVLSTNSPA